KRPALRRPKDWGIEPYAETVARSVHTPGGWGAEESGARSGSGPEATIHYFAIQLGACLAEMGLHCESINESVIPPVKNAAPRRLRREISQIRPWSWAEQGSCRRARPARS